MRTHVAAAMLAVLSLALISAPAFAAQNCVREPMPLAELLAKAAHNGFKPTVSVAVSPKIAGLFLVNAAGEWIELWVAGSDACPVDGGEHWQAIPAAGSATPAPAPKEGVTPDAPDANGSITF